MKRQSCHILSELSILEVIQQVCSFQKQLMFRCEFCIFYSTGLLCPVTELKQLLAKTRKEKEILLLPYEHSQRNIDGFTATIKRQLVTSHGPRFVDTLHGGTAPQHPIQLNGTKKETLKLTGFILQHSIQSWKSNSTSYKGEFFLQGKHFAIHLSIELHSVPGNQENSSSHKTLYFREFQNWYTAFLLFFMRNRHGVSISNVQSSPKVYFCGIWGHDSKWKVRNIVCLFASHFVSGQVYNTQFPSKLFVALDLTRPIISLKN